MYIKLPSLFGMISSDFNSDMTAKLRIAISRTVGGANGTHCWIAGQVHLSLIITL